jgi:predicted CoA-binding protein
MPNIKGDDGAIKTILSNSKIIAVVGHSEKPNRPNLKVFQVSATTGEGLETWYSWLKSLV